MRFALPCITASGIFAIAELAPIGPLEKLTLDGVLFFIIWYLLSQGKGILDKFAVVLEENTKAIRRVSKRLDRIEKSIKPEPWSDVDLDPEEKTTETLPITKETP